jgi:hypothetical protein
VQYEYRRLWKLKRLGVFRFGKPENETAESGAPYPDMERHRAQMKIPGLGQTMLARAAHLFAQTGYFYSAWFSLGNDSRPEPR